MLILIANHPHMQLAISLSFVKLLWLLVRFISYSHDQDHVHIHTICYASTLGASTPLIHPQNKNLQNLEKPKNIFLALICVVSMVWVFLVEMMNSCSVNFLHMLSYNFVLCLVLGSLAISSNFRTWNSWVAKKHDRNLSCCEQWYG